MTQPKPANKNKVFIGVGALVVLTAVVIWLNFGRGGGAPDSASLDAARKAASEMAANQPPEEQPATPPPPAPAKPSALGGR